MSQIRKHLVRPLDAPDDPEPLVLWALDHLGYELSITESRTAHAYAGIAGVREMFDRWAQLFEDLTWVQVGSGPPVRLKLANGQSVAFDDATWAEVVEAMAVDALQLLDPSDAVPTHRIAALGHPAVRRLSPLVKYVGDAGPKWRTARRRLAGQPAAGRR